MPHRKWLYRSLIVAAGAAFALPALAQRDSSMVRTDNAPGFYAGATVGANDDGELTWGILGGYNINRNFAAELAYHDTGESNIDGVAADTTLWELVGLGRIPLDNRFSFYGKVGFYRGRAEGSVGNETNNDLTFGAGVQYDLSRELALRGEWQRYNDMGGGAFPSVDDVDVMRVGVLYRFQ